jgi:formamidopyrimidine-DNA glycosylase
MPELPEVETVVRDLRPLLVGRTLLGIRRSRKALRQVWDKKWDRLVAGRKVTKIQRRGKWILLTLEGGGFLMVHLGMTGQFTVVGPDSARETHTHVVFPLDDGQGLRFRDVRRFGSITYFPDQPGWEAYLAERLGPEPWDVDPKAWRKDLKRTRRPIKAVLLDQCVVAGVGNIYGDEACFAARIDPRRLANELRPTEANRLLQSVQKVLDRAIESRGSTIRDYVGGSGLKGGFQNEFAVYGRKGKPCLRCGTTIQSTRLGGRTTCYCPKCQR